MVQPEGAVILETVVRGSVMVLATLAMVHFASSSAAQGGRAETVVWKFDRLDNIGGHKTTVLGQPRVIDSPVGKAVEFDGVDDALFIDHHPLAGAETFTWEAIFRPDRGQTGAAMVSSERAESRYRGRHRKPHAL